MEHNNGYYQDLVMYELRTEKRDFDAFVKITRMITNPCILAEQKVIIDRVMEGYYLIMVTEAVMNAMKKVVNFKDVQRVDDVEGKYKEVMKKYYPRWA